MLLDAKIFLLQNAMSNNPLSATINIFSHKLISLLAAWQFIILVHIIISEKGGLTMPELVIWKRQQLNKLRRDMDRMLERIIGDFRPASSPGIALKRPQFDLVETDKDLILRSEIPGLGPNDIEINITENILTIEVEIQKDTVSEYESHQWIERRHGTLSKSIPIPRRIILSRVEATYNDGILKVVMPKYSGEEKRGVKVKLG